MDISNITDLTTLKAMAYDELAKVEQAQKNLQLLNQQMLQVGNVEAAAAAANPKAHQEQLPIGGSVANESESTGDADDTSTTTSTTVSE